MTNAFEFRNVSKHFPGFSLENLSFSLPGGCIMGLIGENGAGKSTTIGLLLGLLRHNSGEIRLLGGEVCDERLQDVGAVLDDAQFPDCLNAADVGRTLCLTYRSWNQQTYDGYLDRFHLPRDKAIKTYSRGMKVKLMLAAALSHDAKLLVLDEATSGLDPIVRDEILDILIEYTRDEDHSILISSHITSDLEKICDIVAFLHEGRLVFCQEKDELLDDHALISGSEADLRALPEDAILGVRRTPYGAQALVARSRVPAGFECDRATLEDIILYMSRE
ncbi:MAG: ABC transporter ATP-binding protein [Clostridia bacterium]|nr:ABC transporter ATP-binding protein [Clostridia bacterium]